MKQQTRATQCTSEQIAVTVCSPYPDHTVSALPGCRCVDYALLSEISCFLCVGLPATESCDTRTGPLRWPSCANLLGGRRRSTAGDRSSGVVEAARSAGPACFEGGRDEASILALEDAFTAALGPINFLLPWDTKRGWIPGFAPPAANPTRIYQPLTVTMPRGPGIRFPRTNAGNGAF